MYSGIDVDTERPSASRVTTVALPEPVMPGTLLITNGPPGTSPLNWRTLFTYRSTDVGTTALPDSAGTGNVTRSGRRPKLLRHCTPPMRSERVHDSDDEIVSPNCVLVSVAGPSASTTCRSAGSAGDRRTGYAMPVLLKTPAGSK